MQQTAAPNQPGDLLKTYFDVTVEAEKLGEEKVDPKIFDEPTDLEKVEPTAMPAF